MFLIRFWTMFTKITAWPVQKVIFRTKIFYEDPAVQKRAIHGPAIIISNHLSVYDYAIMLFVFFWRTLRYQMAEVLFEKQPLGTFLKMMGGIRVNRMTKNFSFLRVSEEILASGGVVGIFPESRLPRKGEERPLPFTVSASYLALSSGVKVIPVYTNGRYFQKKRAAVIIGKPILARELVDESLTEKESIDLVAQKMREKVIALGKMLDERYE